jgi:putative endonuclease
MGYAFVYIIANLRHTTLYTGVTNDLRTRLWEHRTKQNPGSFSSRYNLCKLVYFRSFDSIEEAIRMEKLIKSKGRKWKEALIGEMNPGWEDLTGYVDELYKINRPEK